MKHLIVGENMQKNAYTSVWDGKKNRKLDRQKAISGFDKEMNKTFGKRKMLTEEDLQNIVKIEGCNAGRLKFWVKKTKKKISIHAIDFLEKEFGEATIDDFPEKIFGYPPRK